MFPSLLLCNRGATPPVGGRRTDSHAWHSPTRIDGKPDNSRRSHPQLRWDIKVHRNEQRMAIRLRFGDYFRLFRKRIRSMQDNFVGRVVVVM